jgi:replicative DNA helicase
MKLSAPVHVLKRQAKDLKRANAITLTQALDQIAVREGFASWGLLQARAKTIKPETYDAVLDYLHPGDLVLVGARPGLGKTTLAMQVLTQAVREGRQGFFFSLEYTPVQARAKAASVDAGFDQIADRLTLDCSDAISADYIINQTRGQVAKGAVIAVDYLQLLDQQRNKAPLQQQVEDLKAYAREVGCIVIFISQIDRRFDADDRTQPGLDDVRLPNPLDLGLFNKSIFVEGDRVFA